MRDLRISRAVRFDQNVAVNKSFAIFGRIDDLRTVFGINQIQLTISRFDPVVAHDQSSRTIFQIISARAVSERSEAIVLKRNADASV